MGISIQEAGIGVRSDKYCLVNLNADPSMNELLVYYLKVGVGEGETVVWLPWECLSDLGLCPIERDENRTSGGGGSSGHPAEGAGDHERTLRH